MSKLNKRQSIDEMDFIKNILSVSRANFNALVLAGIVVALTTDSSDEQMAANILEAKLKLGQTQKSDQWKYRDAAHISKFSCDFFVSSTVLTMFVP